ncbi:unnamed protein product [Camellia sinensis]
MHQASLGEKLNHSKANSVATLPVSAIFDPDKIIFGFHIKKTETTEFSHHNKLEPNRVSCPVIFDDDLFIGGAFEAA